MCRLPFISAWISPEPAIAAAFKGKVLPAMLEVRKAADALEPLVSDELWPLPKYREMLFQY